MIWNILSHKLTHTPALLCATLLLITATAFAQPVDVKVHVKGDTLYVDTNTTAAEPQQRMNPDPAYLELTFPKSALSEAFSKPIDKGLIQKVVTTQENQSALVRVYVLSKPKSQLTKTDTGYRYTLKLSEMAGAPARTAAAPSGEPAAKPEPPAPVEKPAPAAKPPVAEKPAPIAKPPVAERPAAVERPAPVEKPVAAKPVEKPRPTTKPAPPAAQPPATKPAETRTVTVAPSQVASSGKLVREYFPFKTKSAEKAMNAAQLAFPNVTYLVDPVLNVLMVEGTAQDIEQLEKFLRAQSPK